MVNKKRNRTYLFYFFGIYFLISFFSSCANKAQGPTGGPKDTIPPQIIRSVPQNGALNFAKKQILVDFDENISVEKIAENVIISPPQRKPPEIKAIGKRLVVNLLDTLKPNTTYTIDFGNAIVDLNEKNPLKNYVFSFSTGNEIDSLKIAGTVINAEDLNPISGIIVGIYDELSDSVFLQKPFLRIGRTDEEGDFSINNVKKNTYRIYALGDVNRDYHFQPGEGLAFTDSLIIPDFRKEEVQDTIWKDSVTIDTIRTVIRTHFLPDDILLRYFKESKKRQYLVKYERKQPYMFTLYFNTSLAEMPHIKPLNFDWEGKHLVQKNNTNDTITYWLTDSICWEKDTLQIEMTYLKTDSLYQLIPTTDTLNIFMRKAISASKSKAQKSPIAALFKQDYKFTTNLTSTFEIYLPIQIRFNSPLANVDLSKIQLSEQKDSLFKPLPVQWHQVDSTQMFYAIDYKWEPQKTYKFEIDSAAFTSIYHQVNKKYSTTFKIRSLDEYASLKIVLAEYHPNAIIQLLDEKDKVLYTKAAQASGTVFEYLKPTSYYVRMFLDENGNGKWDTGDFSQHRQPEEVFYLPKKMTLIPNWEFEEVWDYKAVPLLKQKPKEIRKDASKQK